MAKVLEFQLQHQSFQSISGWISILYDIISETSHSVTSMNGEGFYSHQEIKVLITIVHKREAVTILRLIQETDPRAFVSQSRAEGVYGNGFKAIRA